MIINTSKNYAARKNKSCIINITGLNTYPDDKFYYTGYNMEYNVKLGALYYNLNRMYGYNNIDNYISYSLKDHIHNMINNIVDMIEFYFTKIWDDVEVFYNLDDEDIYNKLYSDDEEYLIMDDDILNDEINKRDVFRKYTFINFIDIVNSYYKVPFITRNINHFKKYYYDDVFYFMDHPDFNILYQYCLYLVNVFDIFYDDELYNNIVYEDLFYDDTLIYHLIYEIGL